MNKNIAVNTPAVQKQWVIAHQIVAFLVNDAADFRVLCGRDARRTGSIKIFRDAEIVSQIKRNFPGDAQTSGDQAAV